MAIPLNVNQANIPSLPSIPGIAGLGGNQTSNSSNSASIDPAYLVTLDIRGDKTLDSSGSKIFPIVGYLPETFNIAFSSNWEAPLEGSSLTGGLIQGLTGGRISSEGADLASGAFGVPTRTKAQSFQIWKGSSAMNFSFEMVFHAQKNTNTEIRDKHIALLKLAAPKNLAGTLLPPGPSLAKGVLSANGGVTLQIGKYLLLDNVVITSVGTDVQSRFDALGNPISLSISLSVSSFFTSFDHDDIDKMFAGPTGVK